MKKRFFLLVFAVMTTCMAFTSCETDDGSGSGVTGWMTVDEMTYSLVTDQTSLDESRDEGCTRIFMTFSGGAYAHFTIDDSLLNKNFQILEEGPVEWFVQIETDRSVRLKSHSGDVSGCQGSFRIARYGARNYSILFDLIQKGVTCSGEIRGVFPE